MRTIISLFFLFIGFCAIGKCMEKQPRIISAQKIWSQGDHCAFTDLIRYRDQWFCVFREAVDHVGGGDGAIRILQSDNGENWNSVALLSEDHIDLRDPKLSITPDNRLMLLVGGSQYSEEGEYRTKQPRVLFSDDGRNWSQPQKILYPQEWLWRVTWHEGKAYGVSYRSSDIVGNIPEWIVTLFVSEDGIEYEKITQFQIDQHPSEATIRFLDSGEMIVLIRRSKNAWIGRSQAPYLDWEWKDAGMHLGGPNFLVMSDGTMWASGREVEKLSDDEYKEKVILAKMDLEGVKRTIDLPSGGDDTSYPGIVEYEGEMWISYYSSHEDEKAEIYLVRVKLI